MKKTTGWEEAFYNRKRPGATLTNACDMEGLFDAVVTNSKFLYSSFYGCTNQDVIDFFEHAGVRTKIERGERVFPASDHSSDVIRALERELEKNGVKIRTNCPVKKVRISEEQVFLGYELENGSFVEGDAGIVATGGLSYPSTGSTGRTGCGLQKNWAIR